MPYDPRETPDQAARRRDRDLHALRMLAWCVMRDRYSAERPRVEGGHRGSARIWTFTFYLEAEDYREADESVRAAVAQRAERT